MNSTKASPTLVLIHAFPMHSGMWILQREAFRDVLKVYTPDLPGFASEPPLNQESFSMKDGAAFIKKHLEIRGIERCILGGLSMGGYIAFECWRLFPEKIAGLLLADTRASADSDEARKGRYSAIERIERGGYIEFADTLLRKLVSDHTRNHEPEVVDALRSIMHHAHTPAVIQALRGMAERHDSQDLLSTISVPVQLVFGENDSVTPIEEGEKMCREIPDAKLTRIAKAGHLTNIEQAEAFNRAVDELIARVAD